MPGLRREYCCWPYPWPDTTAEKPGRPQRRFRALLSSCGGVSGVGYERSALFARRVLSELSEKPDLRNSFYIGYCMDTPHLWDFIRFSGEYHSPAAGFLQMNGFAFREAAELRPLMRRIREEGVELIDLTFYGTEEYHDGFAGRRGDFRFIVRMLSAAVREGLPVNVSIPLLKGNLNQLEELRIIRFRNTAASFLTAKAGAVRFRIRELQGASSNVCRQKSETPLLRFHIGRRLNGWQPVNGSSRKAGI